MPWTRRAGRAPACLAGLPISILVAFGLLTWAESFPITAFTWLLLRDLKLDASTITVYYSVTFMPFMWKPFFGWISDTFPIFGYRRTPYLTLGAAAYAATFVWTAYGVWTTQLLFAAGMARAAFASFLDVLMGGFLIDVARQDTGNSAKLQAVTNAAKSAGTLLAQLSALVVYVHTDGDGGATAAPFISTRGAIAWTGLAPAALAVLAPLLPEERSVDAEQSECRGRTSLGAESVRFAFTVFAVQANLALLGCQSFMDPDLFRAAAIALGLATAIALALLHGCRRQRQSDNAALLPASAVPRTPFTAMQWVRLCFFCFAVNAIPTSGVLVNLYQSAIFTDDVFQTLSIASSVSSIGAALAFGRGLNRRRLTTIFVISVAISCVVGLFPLPYVQLSEGTGERQGFQSTVGMLAFAATMLGGLAGMFAVLPVDTLVTTVCGRIGADCSSTAYAVLVSFYDFGATIGGLVAAPLQWHMGLDGKSWGALPRWVAATAALKLLVLPMLLLLPRLPDAAAERGSSIIVGGGSCVLAAAQQPGSGGGAPTAACADGHVGVPAAPPRQPAQA